MQMSTIIVYMYVNMGQGLSVHDARKVTGQAKCPTEAERITHVEDSKTQSYNKIIV